MFVRECKRWLLAEPTAPPCAPQRRDFVRRYVDAARQRIRFGRDLSSSMPPVASAVLLRDGVTLLARAAIAALDDSADETTLASLAPSDALATLRAASMRDEDADTRRVDAAMTTQQSLYFDSLDEAELLLSHAALVREAAWLRSRIDLRSRAYQLGTRFGRLGAVALVVVYVAVLAISSLAEGKNLARGKHVTMSSRQPGTPDPSGLVDGKTSRKQVGAHTSVSGDASPWVLIDLEKESSIHKIVVYNRGDRNLDDGLPYVAELSSDGSNFHEVARRATPFGDGGFLAPPWMIRVHERARYVRLRANWYIALGEVEVF